MKLNARRERSVSVAIPLRKIATLTKVAIHIERCDYENVIVCGKGLYLIYYKDYVRANFLR